MKRIFVILCILLSACTVEPVPVDMTRGMATDTPTPMPDLAGTAWELTLINGRAPILDSRITLVFADGRAGGFAGCNEYGSDYTSARDGSFAIPEIAINAQDCPSPEGVMEQETAYVQALTQAVRYHLDGDQLALLTAVGETTLTFTRQPEFAANPADLVGVAWQLVEWHGRDLLPDTEITLVFDGSGAISGYAGCRHYLGSYQAENDDIRFPMLSMVEGSCDLDEAYLLQEGDFTTALSQARQYWVENGQLELFTNPGERLLFVPVGAEIDPSSGETPEQPAASPIQLGAPRLLGRGQLVDAAFTPDGTGVAVAWPYGVSFTAVTGAAKQWFQPLPASPVAIAVRPDGQAVAVALADGNVMELAAADGRAQTYPVVHANARLGDIAYAPDGRRIAVHLTGTNRFNPIFVLDLAGGHVHEIPETGGGGDTGPHLVWSPDGTAVTLASRTRGCGHIVDVETGERLFTLQRSAGCYSSYAVAWSPDGRTLTLNSPNNSIDTIDFASQMVIQSIPSSALFFQPSTWTGRSLFASPDGRWLASIGSYGYFGGSVWEAATGELVRQLENPAPIHRLVSSFAGNAIISLYADGTLTRWAFDEGATEETVGRLPVYAVHYPYFWSPDGRKIATPTDYQFVIWDVESTQPVAVFDLNYPVATFSPDSKLVALVDTATNEMVVYDLAARAITQTFANVTARVEGVAFSPDGRYLAYGSGNEVIIVDRTTGAETAVLAGYPADQHITWIIWSPTGSALMAASGNTDGTGGEEEPGAMMVWQETAVGDFRELFHIESVRANYAAKTDPIALFNPGGTLVALESLLIDEAWLYKIFVYDLEQEKVILEIPDHQLSIWTADDLLLTSQEQSERRLTQWDVRTGSAITGQASNNSSPIFAPTGDYFAQMSTTPANIVQSVEVRDWRSNQILAQAPVGNDVGQMSWSPDGRYLTASASNGTLTLWPIIRH
ncbi:MAG: META domain-containing protein [Anaerolineae bacterium]|nr:META domain-containing protein [Anaerolineae bacterium]